MAELVAGRKGLNLGNFLLELVGKIPDWLEGSLYRNGPGKYEIGDKAYFHLFDGLACLHKFTIKNGKVTYLNKILETVCAKKSIGENRLYPMFGTSDVCSNVFGRFKTIFKPAETNDNVNINVVPFVDSLYALGESSSMMCKLDPNDLSVLDTVNVTSILPSVSSTIAHPHIEGDGGWIICGMNLNSRKRPHYDFLRYKGGEAAAKSENAFKLAEVIASVPSSQSSALSYFHSFGLTKNYIVFLEQSMLFSLKDYLSGMIKNKPYSDSLKMDKNLKTRIHLINRHTGELVSQRYVTDPLFVFHHINAYEVAKLSSKDSSQEDNLVVIDICAYDPKTFDINKFSYEEMFSEKAIEAPTFLSTPARITVPLKLNSTSKDDIYCRLKRMNPNISLELPVINYDRCNGEQYKYVFGVNHFKAPYSVIKLNVDHPKDFKEKKYSDFLVKELPTEPIFVENPNPTSEDDGVLLVMVLSDKYDYLSILDAKSLEEIAKAELPSESRASMTFHGFFADNRKYKNLNK